MKPNHSLMNLLHRISERKGSQISGSSDLDHTSRSIRGLTLACQTAATFGGPDRIANQKVKMKRCPDRAQRLAARCPALVRMAAKVRNQAEAMTGYAIAPTPDPARNGERDLLEAFANETRLLTPDGPRPFDYSVFREFFRYANFIAAPAPEWQTPASP